MSYFFVNFFPQFYLSFWRYNYWHFQEKLEHTDILSFVFFIYIYNKKKLYFIILKSQKKKSKKKFGKSYVYTQTIP